MKLKHISFIEEKSVCNSPGAKWLANEEFDLGILSSTIHLAFCFTKHRQIISYLYRLFLKPL